MTSSISTTFWQNAYQNHAPKIFGLCRRYVSDLNAAEDLMHDTFITAINKQHSYENKGSFEGWLSRIAINTALMYLRKQKQWAIESIEDIDLGDSENDAARDEYHDAKSLILTSDFQQDELLVAIDLLPLHHKTVFNLYVFDSFSHQQIAEQLQISVGTSKSHLSRARKKIQEILLQMALEKKKKNRKIAVFMSLSTDNKGYIDDLYKSKLNNLHIAPNRTPDVLKKVLKDAPAPPAPRFIISKMMYTIACISAIAVIGIFLSLSKKNTNDPPISNIENGLIDTNSAQSKVTLHQSLTPTTDGAEQIGITMDTAQSVASPNNDKKHDLAPPKVNEKNRHEQGGIETIEKQTVIINKKVIKKDTIFK
jgi:RNA polymerase sigma factor (sigma-70 family)